MPDPKADYDQSSPTPPPHDAGNARLHEALRPVHEEETRRILRAAEPAPIRRIPFFSDMPDKGLFLAFFVLGCALIFTAKLNFLPIPLVQPKWIAAGVAVITIVLYAGFAYLQDAYRGKPDSLGDNCYYMGFLFTLISLSLALIELDNDISDAHSDVLQSLISGFGVALFSTIAGILLRVIFMQMRREIVDLEEQLRHELQNSAALLTDQLAKAIMDLENLRLRTSQIMNQNVDDAAKSFSEVATVLVEYISTAGTAYRDASERLSQNAQNVAVEIGRLVERVDQVKVPSDLLTRQVEDARVRISALATSLEAAAAAGARQIEESRTRVDSLADAFAKAAQAGGAQRASIDSAAAALDAFVARATDLSILRRVDESIGRFGENIEAAGEKLSSVSDRLERTASTIRQSAGQIIDDNTTIAQAKAAIAKDLTQSTASLHKLQSTLVDVAEGLVARLTAQTVEPGPSAAPEAAL